MLSMKNLVREYIQHLRLEHYKLCSRQFITPTPETRKETLQDALIELKKAWIELKVSIARALIGESK